ncbi:MAG: 30S ribosome-binding factor RbfA [Nitrospiraceae bacterium]|nr:30S ribosome-binding factor RbfA [Nitrospiraceae bacterium]
MHPYKRSKRVGDLIKEEISEIIMRRLKDPRIGFVTVTDVSVTEDLRLARVYVSVLKEEEREQTMEILRSARAYVRSELARRLRMKVIPDIEFRIDTSIEYGSRIDKLLKEIKSGD